MRYFVTSDSFTKIGETEGTIQNVDSIHTVEMSDSQNFDCGILIYPHQKHSFNGARIFLRCIDGTAEVRVVPFEIDVGTGGESSEILIDGEGYHVATDAQINNMLDEVMGEN